MEVLQTPFHPLVSYELFLFLSHTLCKCLELGIALLASFDWRICRESGFDACLVLRIIIKGQSIPLFSEAFDDNMVAN